MADICTCGAQLVPDALFCHKCGRPLREIVAVEPVPVYVVPPPAPAEATPPPVNFRNRSAVRIAALMAVLSTPFLFLPYLNWLAAGFFAAVLYRRRTGNRVNLESGVRLGWITGVMMFVIVMVLLTLTLGMFNALGGFSAMPPELKKSVDDPRIREALKSLQSAPAVAQLLAELFMFTTLLSMAGGALGAKLAGRKS
jgi:hypothetical protein